MVKRRLPRMSDAMRFGGAVLVALLLALVVLPGNRARGAEPVECWRGWGYMSDPETRTYTSGELLLVTRGATDWQAGLPVELYLLDRASGRIAAARPPMTVIPSNPRTYYRGRTNYVDGRAAILGSAEELVFGLSHVAPPAGGLEAMRDYNLWACGLAARE